MGKDPHNRRLVSIATIGGVSGVWTPFAHCDCIHNQERALVGRVLGSVPQPTPAGLRVLNKVARSFRRTLPRVESQHVSVMPNSYADPKKRARYLTGMEEYLRCGIDRSDAKLSMFVKFEKLNPKKVNPDPRAIQFRTPKYCVALGQHLQPVEHMIYEYQGVGGFPRGRLIGKGLNGPQRARLLAEKFDQFKSPVVVSIDMSRFDQHVSKELLVIEHSIYSHCNPDPELRKLLSWQRRSKGRSSQGIKYEMLGRRASGDMNTGLGNSVLMLLMIHASLPFQYNTVVDGDDALIFTEQCNLGWLQENLSSCMLEFGMEVKLENITREFSKIRWCQCSPIQTANGLTMVRDPLKVLSHGFSGAKYFDTPVARARLMATIGAGELALNSGVPILQEYALLLLRSTSEKQLAFYELENAERYKNCGRSAASEITAEARVEFATAFGFGVQEQLAIEEMLRTLHLNLNDVEIATSVPTTDDWISGLAHQGDLYNF